MRPLAEKLAGSPLLHCLALGGVAAGLLAATTPPPAASPDASEEIALYREALARHYDELPASKERLIRLADFLELTGREAGREARYRAALSAGLDRSDPVVRRYMIEAMRETLSRELEIVPVSEREVREFHRGNRTLFREPRRVRLSHVYVGGLDLAAEQRARRLVLRFEAEGPDPDAAIAQGDAFYGGHQLPLLDRRELAARLGAAFADRVFSLPAGIWSGPIRSSYGQHLVSVQEIREARDRTLAEVAPRIRRELTRRRQAAALAEGILELRAARAAP